MKARRKTILVVDAEAYVRELAQSYLEDAGYRVLVAEDGRKALDLVNAGRRRFHLLLTGWHMPGLDGPGLIAALRATGRKQPMVLWSSHYALPSEPTVPDRLPDPFRGQFDGATAVLHLKLVTNDWTELIRRFIG